MPGVPASPREALPVVESFRRGDIFKVVGEETGAAVSDEPTGVPAATGEVETEPREAESESLPGPRVAVGDALPEPQIAEAEAFAEPEESAGLSRGFRTAGHVGVGIGTGLLFYWLQKKGSEYLAESELERIKPEMKSTLDGLGPRIADLQLNYPGTKVYAHITITTETRDITDPVDRLGGVRATTPPHMLAGLFGARRPRVSVTYR